MTKNIVVFQSSGRRHGNSNILAEQAATGAAEAGAKVDNFYLSSMDIRGCTGCDACLKTGECVIKDDMRQVYPKMLTANALILSTPIYWSSYSGVLKTCIDRWYALWNRQRDLFKNIPVGIIMTFGDTDVYTSGAINAIHSFESMFRFTQANIAGWVYGSLSDIGDAQKSDRLMAEAYQLGKSLVDLASETKE